jgi:hypothetical protein
MKRLILTLGVSAVIVAVLATFAGAFTMSEKIVVANQLVAISRVPAGGFTADQRIDRVNERLAYILGYERLAPRDIYAVRMGHDRAIFVGNKLLVTVTPADARANHATVAELTRYWIRNARMAIPQARPNENIPIPGG